MELLLNLITGTLSLIFLLVVVVISLIVTVIQGIPLYRIAKVNQVPNAWLSFLPVGNTYILLSIPNFNFQFMGLTFERRNLFWKYLLLCIVLVAVGSVFSSIPVLGVLGTLISWVGTFLLQYKLYLDFYIYCNLGSPRLCAVASVFVPFVFFVCSFICASRVCNKTQSNYTYYN